MLAGERDRTVGRQARVRCLQRTGLDSVELREGARRSTVVLREERESGQNSEGEGGENGTYLVRPGQRRAWTRTGERRAETHLESGSAALAERHFVQ